MSKAKPPFWCRSRPARFLLCAAALCLIASLGDRAVAAEDLAAYAKGWAERSDFSGSWRLERGEQVLAEGSRGFVQGSSGPAINADTVFWIGSISKQFAAVAILKLAEQGRVQLAAPLTRYLPELSASAISRQGVECTIEQVLAQTCGLVRDAGNPWELDGHLSRPEREARLLALTNHHTLAFQPGTDFLYSNLGYSLIGLVVQRASGKGYEQFLQEQFWAPLGMAHTGIHLRPGVTLARGTTGAVFGWVDAADWWFFDVNEVGERGADCNIYSTPRDLLRWTHALHHGGLLQPSSYAELIRPRLKDYGLGLHRADEVVGKLIDHDGALLPQGYTSQIAYLPEADASVVVLTNRPLGAGSELPFAGALLRKLLDKPEKQPAPPALLTRLFHSLHFLSQLLLAPWLLWMLGRRIWHRRPLDRSSWWLSYHAHALLLACQIGFFRSTPLHPALVLWLLIALAGAGTSRWWALPDWQPQRAIKPSLVLGLRSLWLLLIVLIVPQPIFWVFAGLCMAEALLLFAATRSGALSLFQARSSHS